MRVLLRCIGFTTAAALLSPQVGVANARHSSGTAISAHTIIGAAGRTPPQRIVVPEPARPTLRPWSRPGVTRPPAPRAMSRPAARPAAGPPMLRPNEIDQVLSAARARAKQRAPQRSIVVLPAPAPSPGQRVAAPGRQRGVPAPAKAATRTTHSVPSSAGTGINPWWRYQEQNVPGNGRLMVNVGTGNMLLQDDDMSVPHKGVALAFRRTYNSQSGHDVSGSDGSIPGLYGNGWTNTFDAHVSASGPGGITVWDIDGARYDYTLASDNVTWIAPTGQHATLVSDGGAGLLWTKKSGTTYYFWLPANSAVSGSSWEALYGAYEGRLYAIIGRNRNTYVTFGYGWDNGNTTPGSKFNALTATTESGLAANLSYADVSGHRLLQQIVFPDGATSVLYSYDAAGNLIAVWRPANNASGVRPVPQYGYQTLGTGSIMYYATSARWNGSDGGYLVFGFTGANVSSSAMGWIAHVANVNPVPADGTNAALQTGYSTNPYWYSTEWYQTGIANPTYRDSDGHMTNWVVDSIGRPTQTQECTASANQAQSCTGLWLVTNEAWDADNNLTAETDARGNETDYAYDANGNTVAVGEPLTTVQTADGSAQFKPTRLFSHDANNNVTAFCDSAWAHRNGHDWEVTGNPGSSDALCPAVVGTPQLPGTTVITYQYPNYEPSGEVSSIVNAFGYHRALTYAPASQQGADYGLPTAVTGDAVGPQADGTFVQPRELLSYDPQGNLTSYNNGIGSWALAYDALNRMTSATDPDGYSSYRFYYPDGSLQRTETAAQHATGQGVIFDYDLDGDVVHETHHYGCVSGTSCTPGVTTKWYDGDNRLVEVQQPIDPSDFYTFPWTTRYLYDLTGSGSVSITGSSASYRAYGNLYKTQELLAAVTPSWNEPAAGPGTGTSGPVWMDQAGTATDALDRAIQHYRSTGTALQTVVSTFDGNSTGLGFLTSSCNALNECSYFTYDERGLRTGASSNLTNTPARTYGYDEDGRLATAVSANGSIADTYNAIGGISRRIQNGAATVTYHYYPDGKRSGLDINAGAGGSWQNVLSYSYRADGLLSALAFAYQGTTASWAFTFSHAGRPTQRSDTLSTTPYTLSYAASGYGRPTVDGPQSNLTYDAEGDLTSLVLPNTEVLTATYTTRGELVNELGWDQVAPDYPTYVRFANGVRITGGMTTDPAASPGSQFTFNALLGAPINSTGPTTCANYNTNPCAANPSGTRFTYDAVGRQKTNDSVVGIKETKLYDAEDHILNEGHLLPGTGRTSQAYQLRYAWGPIGHPFAIGSTSVLATTGSTTPADFVDETLFWDQDTLLFTQGTTSSGYGIDNIKIANFGDYINKPGAPVGVTVWDRDAIGEAVACHTASGAGNTGWYGFLNSPLRCAPSGDVLPVHPQSGRTGSGRLVGHGAIVTTPRSDGVSDGFNSIQGGRTFDTRAGVWTTPDAYRGDVHDPMSQKPYMWNRNNPYEYSDPSGFDPVETIELASRGNRDRHHPSKRPGGGKGSRGTGSAQDAHAARIRKELPPSAGQFRDGLEHAHFVDHGAETGTRSTQEYVKHAQELYENADAKTKINTREGTVYMLDEKTGNVGIYNLDGTIKSYLNPSHRPTSTESSSQFFDRQKGPIVPHPKRGSK